MMLVGCKRTQIVNRDLNQSLLPRPSYYPEIERPRKKIRKDGQQVETHKIMDN
jgi:hypothetical protein